MSSHCRFPCALAPDCTEFPVSWASFHLPASASSWLLCLQSLSLSSWGVSRKSFRAQLSHLLLFPESSFPITVHRSLHCISRKLCLNSPCGFELLQSPSATYLFPLPPSIANIAQFILIPSQPLAQILLVEGTHSVLVRKSESQNLVWEQFPFQG